MARNLTQKLKQSIAKNKQTKIAFTAPSNVQDLINDYLEYYNDTQGERILIDLLLSNIIEAALNGEKDFQKWRRVENKNDTQKNVNNDSNISSSLPLK